MVSTLSITTFVLLCVVVYSQAATYPPSCKKPCYYPYDCYYTCGSCTPSANNAYKCCCSGANRVCLHHPYTHTYSCPCKYGYHEINGNCVQISVSCGTPCSTHGQCYGASNGCTSCVSAYYPNTYKCCCKYDQRCIHVTGAYYCLDGIDRPTIPPIP
ncbi:uncharacterized protein LOC143469078 [Clavelina lepadiformis]|uniref:uncharacterized protein LOC143469078 n=1 Tax=Clavelina lepadiformis TaxID=159417 RepID=UPI0040437073